MYNYSKQQMDKHKATHSKETSGEIEREVDETQYQETSVEWLWW